MSKGSYVRAAFEFANPEPGEICLNAGDVIEVVGEVNDSWLIGRNWSQSSQLGNFPKNFVEPLELPCMEKGQKLFLAMQSFSGEMAEDLTFHRGDLVVGLCAVDAFWWKGKVRDRVGIFPLTFVSELISRSEDDVKELRKTSDLETVDQNCIVGNSGTEGHESSDVSKHKTVAKGRATTDLSAQLEDELSFKKDDVIEIFHRIDDVFALGKVESKIGQFPLAFVEIFEGSLDETKEKTLEGADNGGRVKSKFNWWKDPHTQEEILRKSLSEYSGPSPSFEEQTAPIVVEEEYSLKTSHAFYSKTSDISGEAPSLTDSKELPSQSHSGKGLTFVRSLFKFVPENDNELGFDSHELVEVIGKVDDQWLEGKIGGRRGIFPVGYVEVVEGHSIQNECSVISHQPGKDLKHTERNIHSAQSSSSSEKTHEDSSQVQAGLDETVSSCFVSNVLPCADGKPGSETDTCKMTAPLELLVGQDEMPSDRTSTAGVSDAFEPHSHVGQDKIPSDRTPTADVSGVVHEAFEMQLGESPIDVTGSPSAALNSEVVEALQEEKELSGEEQRSHKEAADAAPCSFGDDPAESQTDEKTPTEALLPAISDVSELPANEPTMLANRALESISDDTVSIPKSCEEKPDETDKHPSEPSDVKALTTDLDISDLSSENSSETAADVSKNCGQEQKQEKPDDTDMHPSESSDNKAITTDLGIRDLSSEDMSQINSEALSSDVIKNCGQEQKQEKPVIKPKPKLKPKPDLSRSITVTSPVNMTTSPKKPGLKKGVSFCVDNVIVYPREPENEELKRLAKYCDIGSHQSADLVEELRNQFSRKSLNVDPLKQDTPARVSLNQETLALHGAETEQRDIVLSPIVTSPTIDCRIDEDITKVHFRKDARSQPLPSRKKGSSEKETTKEEDGLKIGQSLFYSSSTGVNVTPPTTPLKKLPPRPVMPKQSPAQGTVVLPNGIFYRSLSEDEKPKPVPCRPAPPRPASSQSTAAAAAAATAAAVPLMPLEESDSVDFESLDVVKDIIRRMSEIEKDLENLQREEATLTGQLASVASEDRDMIQDKIEFCQANAVGLTEELGQLKESRLRLNSDRSADAPRPGDADSIQRKERIRMAKKRQEENRKKRQETRTKVIQEVIQTEQDYLQSLLLCLETFFSSDVPELKCPPSVDLEVLFGNIYDVVELSQKFINLLEANTLGKPFEEQQVGVCFVELSEEMKRVYAVYCRNHDSVITLLEKYETVPEAQEYFAAIIASMRIHATVFDVGSILIKPVQRILKFPLLLQELLKTTEEDHLDYARLESAVKAMKVVAMYINEFKRRKDLVLKYKKPSDMTLRDMLSRLTVHSYRKKLSRLSMMVVGTLTVDENFSREELKFNALEEGVATILQNIPQYLDFLQRALAAMETVANDTVDYYGNSRSYNEINQVCRVCNCLAHTLFGHFKSRVQSDVLPPLNSLVVMLQGPQKLIRKRYHKLLDYENARLKQKNIRDSDQIKPTNEEVQFCRNNYEALNVQLLEDLPKFYQLSVSVIVDSLCQFILIQDGFWAAAQQEVFKLIKVQGFSECTVGIVESFNIAHTEAVDRLSDLSFVPKSFNPLVDEKRRQKGRRSQETAVVASNPGVSLEQTENQRSTLCQTFSPSMLYLVNEDFEGTQFMDLKMKQGILVGVIKECDPMGNRDRFLITDGSNKGFIQKRLLVPYTGSSHDSSTLSSSSASEMPKPSSSPRSSSSSASDFPTPTKERSLDLSDETDTSVDVVDECQLSLNAGQKETDSEGNVACDEDSQTSNPQEVMRRAEYQYDAEGDVEVSLLEGEVVKVLQQQDVLGNAEWWLVEKSDGKQGYVPAAYMS